MIRIIAVGKIKEKYWVSAIKEYEKRLQTYTKLEIIEVGDVACGANASNAEQEIVKKQEGEKILSKIKEDEFVIALDLHGKDYSSVEISEELSRIFTYQTSRVTFVIAGSLGFSKEVIQRSNCRWKLSNCTFPHQIVRVLVVEQVYRAYKIMKNEIYHK